MRNKSARVSMDKKLEIRPGGRKLGRRKQKNSIEEHGIKSCRDDERVGGCCGGNKSTV